MEVELQAAAPLQVVVVEVVVAVSRENAIAVMAKVTNGSITKDAEVTNISKET